MRQNPTREHPSETQIWSGSKTRHSRAATACCRRIIMAATPPLLPPPPMPPPLPPVAHLMLTPAPANGSQVAVTMAAGVASQPPLAVRMEALLGQLAELAQLDPAGDVNLLIDTAADLASSANALLKDAVAWAGSPREPGDTQQLRR